MIDANDLMLYLGLGLILVIVIGALIGFLVGLRREFRAALITFVLIAIIWIVFGNPNTILDAELSAGTIKSLDNVLGVSTNASSLWTWIVEVAKVKVADAADLFVEGTDTYALLHGLVQCIVKAACLLAGTICALVLSLVVRIFIGIVRFFVWIFKLIFRKKKQANTEESETKDSEVVTESMDDSSDEAVISLNEPTKKKHKKHRGFGALLGAVKAFVIILLLFVPISGIVSIASAITPESARLVDGVMNGNFKISEVKTETKGTVEFIQEYVDAYQNSLAGKIINSTEFFFGDSISNIAFKDLLTFDTNSGEVCLPDELEMLLNAMDKIAPAYSKKGVFDIWKFAKEDPDSVTQAFDYLKESKLFPAVIPCALEYVDTLNMLDQYFEGTDYTEASLIKDLKEVDWTQDWATICQALRDAVDLGNVIAKDVNYFKLNDKALKKVLGGLGSTNFFEVLMPAVIDVALNIETVKNFLGENEVTVNTSKVTWSKELENIADIYREFAALDINPLSKDFDAMKAVEEILESDVKSEHLLKILGYLAGVENGEDRSDLRLFDSVLLPIADVVVDNLLQQNSLEAFSGIISLTAEQYKDLSAKQMWYSDFASLIRIAQYANEMNVLTLDVKKMSLDDIQSLKGIVSNLFDMKLIGGNVEYQSVLQDVKTALLNAAIEKFEFLLPGTDWSGVDWSQEVGKIVGYTDTEGNYHNGLLDVYGQMVELGEELASSGKNPFDIQNFAFDFNTLLADEQGRFIDLVIDAVEIFVDSPASTLFYKAVPNAVNKYLIPILDEYDAPAEGEPTSIPLFNNLTDEEVVVEVQNLLDALRDLGSLHLTTENPSFYAKVNNDGEEAYALSDAVERILKSKLLVYKADEARGIVAQDYRGRIIRIILKLTNANLDIAKEELDSVIVGGPVDYDKDVDKIALLLDTVLDELFADNGTLKELIWVDGKLNLDINRMLEFLLTTDKLTSTIHALQAVFGEYNFEDPSSSTEPASLLSAVLPAVFDAFVKNLLPEDYVELLDVYHYRNNPQGTLTGKELTADLSTLVYVLSQVIEMGAVDLYNNGNISEGNILLDQVNFDHIKNILESLTRLNIVNDNINGAARILLRGVELLSDETIDRINNESFNQFVSKFTEDSGILDEIRSLLGSIQIEDFQDVMALLKSENIINEVLSRFSNSELYQLTGIVETLGEIDLVNYVLPDMVKFGIKTADGLGYDISFLDDLTYEELDGEVSRIGVLLKEVLDLDIFEVYKSQSIKHVAIEEVSDVFAAMGDVVIINKHGVDWIKLGIDKFGAQLGLDSDLVEYEIMDFTKDSGLLSDIIVKVVNLAKDNDLVKLSDLSNIKLEELVTEENALVLCDILDDVVEFTTLESLLVAAVDMVLNKVGGKLTIAGADIDITFFKNLTREQLFEDLHTIATIVRDAVGAKAYEYVTEKDLEITANKEQYVQVIRDLGELNVLTAYDNELVVALYTALNNILNFNIDTEAFSFELSSVGTSSFGELSLSNDINHIADMVGYVIDILEAGQLNKLSDLVSTLGNMSDLKGTLSKFANSDAYEAVGELLIQVPYITTVMYVLPAVADFVTEKLLNGALNGLADVDYEFYRVTVNQLMKDIDEILNDSAIQESITNYITENKLDLPLDKITLVGKLLVDIVNARFVKGFDGEIIEVLLKVLSFKTEDIDFRQVSFGQESVLLEALLAEVQHMLVDNSGIETLQELLDTIKNLKLDSSLFDTLLVEANFDSIEKIISRFNESSLLNTLVMPLYKQLVYNNLPAGDIKVVANLDETYCGNLNAIYSDLIAVVDLVKTASVSSAVDFYFDGADIDFSDEVFGKALRTVFQLSLLNYNPQYLFDNISFLKDIDVELVGVDFFEDGVLVEDIYNEYFATVLNGQDIVKSLEDIKNVGSNLAKLGAYFVQQENVVTLIEGLEDFVQVDTIDLAIYVAKEMFKGLIPQAFQGIVENSTYVNELSQGLISNDLYKLLEVVRIALDEEGLNAYSLLNKEGFTFSETSEEALMEIIDNLFSLYVLVGDGSKEHTLIEAATDMFLGSFELDIDYSNIGYEDIREILESVVENAFVIIRYYDQNELDKLISTVKQDVLSYNVVSNDVVVPAILNILETIVSNDLVHEYALPFAQMFGEQLVNNLGFEFYSSKDQLQGDLIKLVHAVQGLFKVVGGEEISYTDSESFYQFISNILGLEIIEANFDEVCTFANKLVGGLDLKPYDFNLSRDAELLTEAFEAIGPVLSTGVFSIHSIADIIEVVLKNGKVTIEANNALLRGIVEVVDKVVDTSIVYSAIKASHSIVGALTQFNNPIIATVVDELELPQYVYYAGTVQRDIHRILSVVLEMVDNGTALNVMNYFLLQDQSLFDMDASVVLEPVFHLIEMVPAFDLFANKIGTIVQTLLEDFRINGTPIVSEANVSRMSFASEFAIIASMLENLVGSLHDQGLVTINEFLDEFKNITSDPYHVLSDETVYTVLESIKELLNSEVVTEIALDAYRQLGFPIISNMAGLNESFKQSCEFKKVTNEEFISWFTSILTNVESIINVNNFAQNGVVDLAADFLITKVDTTKLSLELDAAIGEFVANLIDADYAKYFEEYINAIVYNVTGLSRIYELNELEINVFEDAHKLGQVITNILDVVVVNHATIQSVLDLVNNKSHQLEYFLSDSTELASIVEALAPIGETTMYNAMYVYGHIIAASLVEQYTKDSTLTQLVAKEVTDKELATEDYNTLLGFLANTIVEYDLGEIASMFIAEDKGLEYIKENVDVTVYAPIIKDLLVAIFSLNTVEDYNALLDRALEGFGISEVSTVGVVDIKEEAAVLGDIIVNFANILVNNNTVTVNAIAESLSNLFNFISDENVVVILDSINMFKDSELVKNYAKDVYDLYAFNSFINRLNLPDYIKGMFDFDELLTNEEFIKGFTDTIGALKELFMINNFEVHSIADLAEDFLNQKNELQISDEFVEALGDFFAFMFSTYLVANNERMLNEFILWFAEGITGAQVYTPEELGISISSDSKLLGETFANIIRVFTNEYQYVQSYVDMSSNLVGNVKEFLKDKAHLHAFVEALRPFGETTLYNGLMNLAMTYGGNILENMFSGLAFYIDYNLMSDAEKLEDYNSVLDLINYIIDSEIATEALTVLDGVDFGEIINSIELTQYAELAKDIVDRVLSLNMFRENLNDVVDYFVKGFKVSNKSSKGIDIIADVDTILDAVIDATYLLKQNEIVYISDVLEINVMSLINDENAYEVIEILKNVLGVELIEAYAFEAYNNYFFNSQLVQEQLKESFREMLDINSYTTPEYAVNGVIELLSEVQKLFKVNGFNVSGLADFASEILTGEEAGIITNEFIKAVGGFVEYLLSHPLVEELNDNVINVALSLIENFYKATNMELEISIPEDAEEISAFIQAVAHIVVDNYNTIGSIKELFANTEELNSFLFTKPVAYKVIDALKELSETTILKAAYIFGLDKLTTAACKIDPSLSRVFNSLTVTTVESSKDFNAILGLLEEAVDYDLVEVARKFAQGNASAYKDLLITKYVPFIEDIYHTILTLDCLEGDLNTIIDVVVKKLNISNNSSVGIDVVAELDVIDQIIEDAVELLSMNGYHTVGQVMNFKFDLSALLTDENGVQAVEIVKDVLDSKLLEKYGYEAYDKLVYNKMGNAPLMIKGLFDLTEIYSDGEELFKELRAVLEAIQSAMMINNFELNGVLDVVADTMLSKGEATLSNQLVDEVAKLVKVLLNTTYVSGIEETLKNIVIELTKAHAYDSESLTLDLSKDSEKLYTFIRLIGNTLVSRYNKVSDLTNVNNILGVLLDKHETCINALEALENSTIIALAYRLGIEMISPALYKFSSEVEEDINVVDMTDEEIWEDYKSIIDLARFANDEGVINSVIDIIKGKKSFKDLVIAEVAPTAQEAISTVFGLNIASDELFSDLVNELLAKFKMAYLEVPTDNDWAEDSETINTIIDMAVELLNSKDVLTVGQLLELKAKKFLDDETIYQGLSIVEEVLSINALEAIALDLADHVLNKVSLPAGLEEIKDLSFYTDSAEFVAEVAEIIGSVKELFNTTDREFGAFKYMKEFVNATYDAYITDEYIEVVTSLLDTVLSSKLFTNNCDVVLDFVLEKLTWFPYTTEEAGLDVVADKDLLVDFIGEALSIAKDVYECPSEFKEARFKQVLDAILVPEMATRIVNALDAFSDSTIVYAFSRVLLEKLDEKVGAINFNADQSQALYQEDFHNLFAILRSVTESEEMMHDIKLIVKNINTVKQINLVSYTNLVEDLINYVGTANILEGHIAYVVEFLVEKFLDVELSTEEVEALEAVDYSHEFATIANMITSIITENVDYVGINNYVTLQDLYNYAKYIKADDDLEGQRAVLNNLIDTVAMVEKLEILDILFETIVNGVLDKVVTNDVLRDTLDVTGYNYHPDFKAIMKTLHAFVNSGLYRVVLGESIKEVELTDTAAANVKTILENVLALEYITANDNERLVMAISTIKALTRRDELAENLEDASLAYDGVILGTIADELVELFKALQADGFKFDLYLCGETETVDLALTILETVVSTDLAYAALPYVANAIAYPAIYKALGKSYDEFNMSKAKVMSLVNDLLKALRDFQECGVFSNDGVTVDSPDHLETNEYYREAFELIMKHFELSSTVKGLINDYLDTVFVLGTVPFSYEELTIKEVINEVKEVIELGKEVASIYSGASDFSTYASQEAKDAVYAVLECVDNSVLLSEVLFPLINSAVLTFTKEYGFILLDAEDGITLANFKSKFVNVIFDAAEYAFNAINKGESGVVFEPSEFGSIVDALDTLFSSKFFEGHLFNLFGFGIYKALEFRCIESWDYEAELEIIKDLVFDAQDLFETDFYRDHEFHTESLLKTDALAAMSSALYDMSDSYVISNILRVLLNKLVKDPEGIVATLVDMVNNVSPMDLREDFVTLSDAVYNLSESHFFESSTSFHLYDYSGSYLGDAIETLFSANMVDGYEGDLFKQILSFVDLSGIDPNLDPVQNVEYAIENKGWSWTDEISSLADLFRALDAVTASGCELISGTGFNFTALVDCTDADALTGVLQAINNMYSLRTIILTVINDNIGSIAGDDSFDPVDFESDWLKAQLADTSTMDDVAVWDNDIQYIAEIIVNAHNISTDFSAMTDSSIDALVAVLKNMNYAMSFNVNAVSDIIREQLSAFGSSGDAIILADTSSWTKDKWNTELDLMDTILRYVIQLDPVSCDGIVAASETLKTNLLQSMNASELCRSALPRIINDSVRTAFEDSDFESVTFASFVDQWLLDEKEAVTVDPSTMSSKEVWDEEIVYIAKLVTYVNDPEIFSIDKVGYDYDKLGTLLSLIRVSKSFHLDFMSSLMEDNMSSVTTDGSAQPLSFESLDSDADERWDDEIPAIVDLLKACSTYGLFSNTFKLEELTKDEIADLLKAMNKSVMARNAIPYKVYNSINNSQPALVSDWLENEYNAVTDNDETTVMSDIATWDEEIDKLAIIIKNADSISFNKDFDLLEEVLTAMNYSKSVEMDNFTEISQLGNVKDAFQYNGDFGTVTYAATPGAKEAAWDAEIEALIDLLEVLTSFGILRPDGSVTDFVNQLTTVLSDYEDLSLLLNTINNSDVFRVILPHKIGGAITDMGATSFTTTFLEEEKVSMSDKATWATEIGYIANIMSTINNADTLTFSQITGGGYTNADMPIIKKLASFMNSTKTFKLDAFVTTIQNSLDSMMNIESTSPDYSATRLNTPTREQWAQDLDVIFGTFDENDVVLTEGILAKANSYTTGVSFEQVTADDTIGSMLNDMYLTALFDGKVNAIFRAIIKKTSAYDASSTSANKLNATDVSDEYLDLIKADYDSSNDFNRGWVKEFRLLRGIDFSAESQSGAVLDALYASKIYGHKMPDLMWQVLISSNMDELYGTKEAFVTTYDQVSNRIDNVGDWSFSDELAALEELQSIMDEYESSAKDLAAKVKVVQDCNNFLDGLSTPSIVAKTTELYIASFAD